MQSVLTMLHILSWVENDAHKVQEVGAPAVPVEHYSIAGMAMRTATVQHIMGMFTPIPLTN
jgi:hypothetical protein